MGRILGHDKRIILTLVTMDNVHENDVFQTQISQIYSLSGECIKFISSLSELTADRLAQLVERRTTVREASG